MAYATNLQAINAARKAMGKDWKEQARVIKLDSGEWDFEYLVPEEDAAPAMSKRQEIEAKIVSFQERIAAAQDQNELNSLCNDFMAAEFEESVKGGLLHLMDARSTALLAAAEPAPTKEEWDAMVKEQEAEAARQANQAQATSGKGKKEHVRASTAIKPTKLVWAIADEMNDQAAAEGKEAPTRAEVQAECVRRGVATGTARTQYQAWKTARDNTQRNAAKAAELSAKFNKGN